MASHLTWGDSVLSFSVSSFLLLSSSKVEAKVEMEDFFDRRGGNFFLREPFDSMEINSLSCSGGTSESGFGVSNEAILSWKSEIIFLTLNSRMVAWMSLSKRREENVVRVWNKIIIKSNKNQTFSVAGHRVTIEDVVLVKVLRRNVLRNSIEKQQIWVILSVVN
jgi:hypothetical protein